MGKPTGLAPELLRALDQLKAVAGIEAWYLAGGNAVHWHLRHRQSIDLDLFSLGPDTSPGDLATRVPGARVLAMTDVMAHITLDGVPVDIVRYPYPLLESPTAGPNDFPVAGLLDLATLKLAAVARRGIRRDFWDLHAIVGSGMSLQTAFDAYVRRFGAAGADPYHVLRALTYFEDADRDPLLPGGLSESRWQAIKDWFQTEVPRLLR